MPSKNYSFIVVQIATPHSIGTGFCLNSNGIIVTNENIVRDSRRVVVEHPDQGKQEGEVLFLDPKRDVAILRIAKPYRLDYPSIEKDVSVNIGDRVVALGGALEETQLQEVGAIKEMDVDIDDVSYIQHSAVLNSVDSGSPLLSEQGKLLGVNTFMVKGGEMAGLALPVGDLLDVLERLELGEGKTGCCCANCRTTVYEGNRSGNECPNCREIIQLPSLIEPYQPVGVAATIESILSKTVREIALARRGPSCWQVEQGSATINISYYEKNGLIIGDAHLCMLPLKENEALYSYLLKQNFKIENLAFSIRNEEIVLSLMIYDRYLNEVTGHSLFQYLFQQADDFDNILVEKYGARWMEKNSFTGLS
ncbi:MAG: serine protease [Saprospiraceae bacterium]